MKDQLQRIAKALAHYSPIFSDNVIVTKGAFKVLFYRHLKQDEIKVKLEVNHEQVTELPFICVQTLVLVEKFLEGKTFYNHRTSILNALSFHTFDGASGDLDRIKVRLGKATAIFKASPLARSTHLVLFNSSSEHKQVLEYKGLETVQLAIEYLHEEW